MYIEQTSKQATLKIVTHLQ